MIPTLILTIMLSPLVAGTSLKDVLKSPRETMKLYQDFKDSHHTHFMPREDRIRFRIFKKSAERVATLNEDENQQAEYELNEFSIMTEEEKQSFLGVNATMAEQAVANLGPANLSNRRRKRSVIPESRDYIEEGMVTPVQDQSNCGSCWAFAAIGSFEGEYKQYTGVLRKFSEQELLDCTYEGSSRMLEVRGRIWYNYYYNGCRGGWYMNSYDYIKRHNHLASAADYSYHESDCKCEAHLKKNSMIGARLTRFVMVRPRTEEAVIEALAEHVLAIAFTVTDDFYPYKRGLWKDDKCKEKKWANHAVTLVGYTPEYVLMKNSWGNEWGDHGYLRFIRNHFHCHLWRYACYPVMVPTGIVDDLGEDEPADFDPVLTDPHPDCEQFENTREDCDLDQCDIEDKNSTYWTVECKRTCNNCGTWASHTGECPPGTQMCGGVCKHAHMC